MGNAVDLSSWRLASESGRIPLFHANRCNDRDHHNPLYNNRHQENQKYPKLLTLGITSVA
jgi:hypothetical protein